MLITLLLSAVGLLELIVAAMVLRNSYVRQNLYFGIFVLSAILWGLGDALMLFSNDPGTVKLGTVIFLVAPLYTTLFVVFFSLIFPQRKPVSGRVLGALALPAILFTLLALAEPSFFIELSAISEPQNTLAVSSTNYLIYTLYFSTYLTAAIVVLVKRYLSSTGRVKAQVALSLAGIAFSSAVSLVTNLSMPIFGITEHVWMGPMSTLAFTVLIAIAIIKHRLFDIRLVIARALGYTFSLVVLASLYGFIVFGIANWIFDLQISLVSQIFLSAATGLAALSFQRIKKFFDKATDAIFYPDSYDPQELFRRLNSMLVSSLDMRYLMMQSISIIETSLKSGFIVVGLKDEDGGQRIFASRKVEFKQEIIDKVRQLTPHIRHKVIVAELLDRPKDRELKELMQQSKVAVLVRLTQRVQSGREGLGYLVLGSKKSGNPYTSQDIRVLDTVANELIIAIQNTLHFEEIQNFNATLQAQVDEATRKLRRTNEKLKALDETKDDFISMASHQLRTPLTSVKGYLSMVLEGDAGKINPTQQKMLSQAFTSSQRMVYLIADLLNVSRLKTGKFIIEPAPTDLSLMIEEELAQLVESAASRDLKLTYSKPKDFPVLMLDETKIRQVVMNFIDNAIYYTPAGGTIKVELTASENSVELRVVDDGIGVPKSEQHHLFTKFYRAGNARKARPDGTGLGLFMAKKVIVAQGGSLIFESKEGQGSTFGFYFSRRKLAAPAPTEQPLKPTAASTKEPVKS